MADPGHGVMIEEDREAVFASYLILFRPFDERYDRYLQYWLRSDRYWNLVRARGAGTTRVSLNARVISAFQLLVLPPLIVEAFHDKVGMLREHVVANVAESSVIATLRDALLPKLISGEIQSIFQERVS